MNHTTAATALMLTKGVGRKLLASIVHRAAELEWPLVDVVSADGETLANRFGLTGASVADLPRAVAVSREMEPEFDRRGIHALTQRDDAYPQRLLQILGDQAPPILFVAGNVKLLSQPAVGFCGSRKASDKGLRVGRDSAAILARQGVNVVSGHAAGVDLEVHRSALANGGTTAFVLAEGILHFRAKRDVASLLTSSNHVVVSEFPPRLTWLARSAMQRNATIIGLSDAMIVIEAGTTGGTFACAESTLKLGHPLFVADYAMPAESAEGNQMILRRGGSPLRGNSMGVPELRRVLQVAIRSRPAIASPGSSITLATAESASSP